ncbi:peptidoglycan bridge formation glycyltransferase FemA/FemB family protein [Natrialbaceae archaeon A-gly3]
MHPNLQMSPSVTVADSIQSVNRNQWNHVVEQSALGTVYHRYGWLEAIERGMDAEPRHLVVLKKGNPIAVFPNFVTDLGPVSRLTSIVPGFGGPVAMTDEESALDLLLETIEEVKTASILTSKIQTYGSGWIRYNDLLGDYGYDLRVEWCRFVLDLDRGWDTILEGMDRSRRQGIRRGHDGEPDVDDAPLTNRTLSTFYESYASIMDEVDHPKLPRSFFLALQDIEDRVKLFSLAVDGVDCGSFLYVLGDERSTVHYLATSVPEEYFEYHATELLHEHAIRWAIKEGYGTYNLRGAKTDFRDGLFRFKEKFGGQVSPTLTWERGFPSPTLPVIDAGRVLYHRFLT